MKNLYLQELLTFLQGRYSIDTLNMSVSEWVEKNTTLRKKPFTLERYPFQREILDDMHPRLSCVKCSQIGLSEVQIRKVLAFLYRNQGTTSIYSMPSKRLRDVMSNTRIQPILEDGKIFNTGERLTRSMEMKQIGNSFLVLPVATEDAATSISADFVIVDEVDLTDEAVLGLFNSRLQNSDFAIRQDFSTPSFADYGIDASYKITDQREYMIKCSCCNHWQIPEFTKKFVRIPGLSDSVELIDITQDIAEGLDLLNAEIVCENCERPLDLKNDQREWVAKRPQITSHRGYQVRPFSTNRITIDYIITQLLEYTRRNYRRGWYNTVLGLPYEDADTRLQPGDINACMHGETPISDEELRKLNLFVGIDVGAMCHITIGDIPNFDRPRVLKTLVVSVKNIVEWVKEFCEEFNVIAGSMDRYPYTPTAEDVFIASKGKIFPTGYGQAANIVHKNDDEIGENYFVVNRTWILDQVQKKVKARSLWMEGFGIWKEMIREHLQNMVRDEQPEKQAVWRKLDKDDHFFHSIAFFLFSYKLKEYLNTVSARDSDPRSMLTSLVINQKPEGKKPVPMMYGNEFFK